MYSFNLVFIAAVFGSVLCDHEFQHASEMPKILSETFQEIAKDSKKMLDFGTERISEDVVEMGVKVKDAMEDMLEQELGINFDTQDDNTTEFSGIDASGCNRGLLKNMEIECDNVYDQVNDEAQQIEDDREKIEAVCCALEDFEKCSLRAYDTANCPKDKAAIRENLKAARLFLSVVANITCTEFRGQCSFYSSAVSSYISYSTIVFSIFISLVTLLH